MYLLPTTSKEPSLSELVAKLRQQLGQMQSRLQKNLSRERTLVDEITAHGSEMVESLQKGESPAEKPLLAALLAIRRLGGDVPDTRDVQLNGTMPWPAMKGLGERLDQAVTCLAGGDLSQQAIQKVGDCLTEVTVAKPIYTMNKRNRPGDPVTLEAQKFVAEIRTMGVDEIVRKLTGGELCKHTARMVRRWMTSLDEVEKRMEDCTGAQLNLGLALVKVADPETTIRKRESRLDKEDAAFIERYKIGAVDAAGIDCEFAKLSEDATRFLGAGLPASDVRFRKMTSRLDELSRQRSLLRRLNKAN